MTLQGVVEFDDLFTARMADIPGLIEGAAQNLGMGHSFLRHIERTRVLLYVVDVTGFQLSASANHVSAGEALKLLANELDLYQPGLHQRPGLLAVNKLDVPGSKKLYNALKTDLRGLIQDSGLNIQTVVPISVDSGAGMTHLKLSLRKLLADHDSKEETKHERQAKANSKFTDSIFPKHQAWF